MSNLKIQGNASGAGTSTLESANTAGSYTYSLPEALEAVTLGYRNVPLSGIKTASYTLVLLDSGKFVRLDTSGVVVVPASIFGVGDLITIYNNTSAAIVCTCSAITSYKAGTDTVVTSFSLATRGVATILFVTASMCVITGNV
jgi:hypothetical protein